MDDLHDKSDDELRSIMASSLPNQYVPSSIYHRAKQELEFRAEQVRKEQMDLSPTAKAVLAEIPKVKGSPDLQGKFITIEVLEHNFGKRHMPKVREALKQLVDRDFIDEVENYDGLYKLTPFGDSYLSNLQTSGSTIYSNIVNSNIAHQSQDVDQIVNIASLPEDIQQSIKELQRAANKSDASAMKRAFGYIADKAVDAAIAIVAGRLK